MVAADPRIRLLVSKARHVASLPWVCEWAGSYREIEQRHAPSDPRPLLERIETEGGTVVVITEGRVTTQKEKIERLGLAEFTRDRTLISQAAGQARGADRLHATVDRLLDALDPVEAGQVEMRPLERSVPEWTPDFCERVLDRLDRRAVSGKEALGVLWPIQGLIRAWSRKTSSFFARCLHAVQKDPRRCESELAALAFVSDGVWHREPLRFVMIGDRYDRDIRPLIDLLGPKAGYRIRLAQGKYGEEFPDAELPIPRRPDRTVRSWPELVEFLSLEFKPDRVHPIGRAPNLAAGLGTSS
jgi:hypothetical protein